MGVNWLDRNCGVRLRHFWIVALFGLVGVATAQTPISLKTRTTAVEVAAADSSPRLVYIQGDSSNQWINSAQTSLISTAEIDGEPIPLDWHLDRNATTSTATAISLVYETANPHLRMWWEWRTRDDSGPIEHTVRIQNLSGRTIWLPLLSSFNASFDLPATNQLKHVYIEKGADTPSPEGTHELPISPGYNWHGDSSTYAHPVPGEAREIIPWSLVESSEYPQSGWYIGLEFSGRIRISLQREANTLNVIAGLNPDQGPYRTRLQNHEQFETPPVFIGTFSGGLDAAGNDLRRWVRDVLGNPRTWRNPQFPFTVMNTWGAGVNVNDALALHLIDESAALGLEMFHLDAGWFRAVGDWHPDPKKFPHGLKPLADAAHQHGMKFGLWADWAQAGLSTQPGALNIHDPAVHDWLVTNLPADWKPEDFKGQPIDLGVPAAHQWAAAETSRLVKDYGLDMLEHDGYLVASGCVRPDHPHAPPDLQNLHIQQDAGFHFVYSPNSTDVSYYAAQAYYDIQSRLRASYPNLLLEICNDGGRMVDFGSAAHGDYFSLTDTYDPLSNRRAFYDASHVLPPAMLESYVEQWPAADIDNFRYMLRSGMMGWFSLMQDPGAWSDQQRAVAKDEIEFYKTALRPLIRNADLYHISDRPDGVHWDAIEYFDPAKQQGVAMIFRGSTAIDSLHTFLLQGLHADRLYRVHYRDHPEFDTTATGSNLATRGVAVYLFLPNSSEIVQFSAVAH